MKRMIVLATLALGACVMIWVTATSAENTVERPMKYNATLNFQSINLVTGDTFGVAFGHSTLSGDFENVVVGSYDPLTGLWEGGGVVTVANGDQRFWEGYTDPDQGGTVVILTGGTGRFEGVTGGMLVKRTSDLDVIFAGPFMIQRYQSTGLGAMSY